MKNLRARSNNSEIYFVTLQGRLVANSKQQTANGKQPNGREEREIPQVEEKPRTNAIEQTRIQTDQTKEL